MRPEEIVKSVKQLVSFPDVVMRANQLLDSPDTSAEEIAEVISHDPALSAQLLKLVNSAFYHFPNQIDTISRAITLVGLIELRSLIIASTTTQCFNRLAPETLDMDAFWQRSVYCGLVAKQLASSVLDENGESLFLTGLLHNIGRLILFAALPEQAQQVVETAEKTGQTLIDVENKILGFGSQELGATLLEHWKLPVNLWEPIRFQYNPEGAPNFKVESKVLQVASKITDCVEPELKTSKELDLGKLTSFHIEDVELTQQQLEVITTEASLATFDVLSIINPDATIVY